MKDLSVIIVTFNARDKIIECISSFLQNNARYEFIVVDNASKDGTVGIIQNKFPQVRLIKNNKNIGFVAAANQGAKIAKGEYLLFLNPDTVVKAGCVEEMVNFLEKKKDAGVVGCKVLNSDSTLQPSCGIFPTISNIIFDRIPILNTLLKTELIRQENFYSKEQTLDWISGVFFLARKDVFKKLGGFDERYFMYVEDVDFCYRAKQAGYKIYYNPKAEIIHYDMGKSKERKSFKAQQMRKGFTIFFKKYKSPTYLFMWKIILFLDSLFRPNLRIS